MDEIGFREWLSKGNKQRKVQTDCISRLRRIERELELDLDIEFQSNYLEDVLKILSNKGLNSEMQKYGEINLPIGKYYMCTYSHSVKEYIRFKTSL